MAIGHNHGYLSCKSDFDTSTFTASSMCCACGGGQTVLPSTSSDTCEHVSPTHLDTEGDTCTHYIKYHLGHGCDGTYDDHDFTASEMCCGCGSATRLCANTNHDLVDAAGNTCSSNLIDCNGHATHRLSLLKSFVVNVVVASNGTPTRSSAITTYTCVDSVSNNDDASCSQHNQNASTCGMYVCDDPYLFTPEPTI